MFKKVEFRLEYKKFADTAQTPSVWVAHRTNDGDAQIPVMVGDRRGFRIQVGLDPAAGPHTPDLQWACEYVLLTSFGNSDRKPAILVRQTKEDCTVLGRVTLEMERLGEWVSTLINRDITSLGLVVGLPQGRMVFSSKEMAAALIEKLEAILKEGLPAVYTDFADYEPDMWADLPWDPASQLEAVCQVVLDPRFKGIADGVLQKFEFSLRQCFMDVITDARVGEKLASGKEVPIPENVIQNLK
jgi:hypothetical protein